MNENETPPKIESPEPTAYDRWSNDPPCESSLEPGQLWSNLRQFFLDPDDNDGLVTAFHIHPDINHDSMGEPGTYDDYYNVGPRNIQQWDDEGHQDWLNTPVGGTTREICVVESCYMTFEGQLVRYTRERTATRDEVERYLDHLTVRGEGEEEG